MKKIYLCKLNELVQKEYIIKWIDEIKDEIIIFYDNKKKLKIFSSICPHFGGEIFLDKTNKLRCKWHDWEFSSETGKCLTYPIRGKLKNYDFEVNPQPLKSYKIIEITKGDIYAIKE